METQLMPLVDLDRTSSLFLVGTTHLPDIPTNLVQRPSQFFTTAEHRDSLPQHCRSLEEIAPVISKPKAQVSLSYEITDKDLKKRMETSGSLLRET
jgi:hypothetical protein